MTELLIAMAIFALVLALVGLPLITAFGYIQKAVAHNEAQNAGRKLMRGFSDELANAEYVFPVPPDGSWVAFVPSATNAVSSAAAASSMLTSSASTVTLVRYSQIPDYPWAGSLLLQPNYANTAASTVLPFYNNYHSSFYMNSESGMSVNPYILTRYTTPAPVVWPTAVTIAQDGSYPLDTTSYTNIQNSTNSGALLKRLFRNDMIAVSPLGEQWDVPHFQVNPLHVLTEALTMHTDGQGARIPTGVAARYPLWAGRNSDLDLLINSPTLTDNLGNNLYTIYNLPAPFDTTVFPTLTPANKILHLNNALSIFSPLYLANSNPFGYQITVFDQSGQILFGKYSISAATDQFAHYRHYMEWPPIDRPDVLTNHLWSADDIARQRMQGQVVFAQPVSIQGQWMPCNLMSGYATGDFYTCVLPAPQNWSYTASAYIVSPPRIIKLSGIAHPFAFVDAGDPAKLNPYQFTYLAKHGAYSKDLQMVFRSPDTLANPVYILPTNPGDPNSNSPVYTICDLTPTDTVVASYSTLGVLDVGLTISRQDRAGGNPAQSRQDATFNSHIEVRNALRRAEGN